jgi:hypothetical protein
MPFRALLAPEEGAADRALESHAMELTVAGLTFARVRLPRPGVDALASVEPGDVAPAAPEPEHPQPAMAFCFPRDLLLGAVPALAPRERDAILAASREGRLTIEAIAAIVGAERAAAVRARFPIVMPGLALRVLEGRALPYMFVRTPGAGEQITIRPGRIRALFPEVSEAAVATLAAEGRARTLTVGRVSALVLAGNPLPGPDGKPLAAATPVAILEP